MAGSLERSTLHVEGPDDVHSIIHLLIHHGIDYDAKPWPAGFPELKKAEGIGKLLEAIETAITLGTGRSIGFVLDADIDVTNRWRRVRDRLKKAGVNAPTALSPDGFIGESQDYRCRVGVWLMPDNVRSGALETFLRDLIHEQDPLISHAQASTDSAKNLGAKFALSVQLKAVLPTWLAWQVEPGLPYGSAIRARYFRHDTAAALSFVAWFKTLYGL